MLPSTTPHKSTSRLLQCRQCWKHRKIHRNHATTAV